MEPRIYGTFVDIWDREDLWGPIDRANLNLPKRVKDNPNDFIHGDVAERGTQIRPSDPLTKSPSLDLRVISRIAPTNRLRKLAYFSTDR